MAGIRFAYLACENKKLNQEDSLGINHSLFYLLFAAHLTTGWCVCGVCVKVKTIKILKISLQVGGWGQSSGRWDLLLLD